MVSKQPEDSTTKHKDEASDPPPTYSQSTSSPQPPPTPQIAILQDGRYGGTPTTEAVANGAADSGDHHHPFFGAPPGSPTLGSSSPRRSYGPTPMSNDAAPAVIGARAGSPVFLGSGAGTSGALLPLPYHDRSSPYAEEQANSRARWRFFEAFVWAFAIWTVLGVLFGTSAVERNHRNPHHRHDDDRWYSESSQQ